MGRAVFLDRDGTINKDKGYVANPEDVLLIPGVTEALVALKKVGYLLIVITNQSGIGRNYYKLEDYNLVTAKLRKMLAEESIYLDDIYFCPHAPEENCSCRKPATKMIERAILKWNITPTESFMVGDKKSDVLAGIHAGVRSIYIGKNASSWGQTINCSDLKEAANFIIKSDN